MGGGLESRCVGRVYGADGAVHHPHRTCFGILWPSSGRLLTEEISELLRYSCAVITLKYLKMGTVSQIGLMYILLLWIVTYIRYLKDCGPGSSVEIVTELRAGRSRIESQ